MAHGVRSTPASTAVPKLLHGKTVIQDGLIPPAALSRSVPLGDLLLIAVLTPAQAVLVAAELLEAAGAPDAPTGRVNAVVTPAGAIEIHDSGGGDTQASVPELLDEIVRSARRLPAHPRPHQLWLLQRLEDQVGVIGQPAERAQVLRTALTEVLGAGGATEVRGELAALVSAFGTIAIPKHASGDDAALPSPSWSVRPHGDPSRQYGVGRRRVRPRTVVISLVVLAVVLGGGYLLVRGPASGLLDHLPGHHPSNTAQGNPPATTHHPKHHKGHQTAQHHAAVPALAPLSSGRVQSVELLKSTSCGPGSTCGVQVTVHLAPASQSQVVTWRVGVVKGCTKHVAAWSPATQVTAQPGWTRVFSSSSVQVPKGHPFSLVALTSTPAHAQSHRVPVAGAAPHC